jgi:anaerobic selenocysteine-containing dehydrogenase
MNDVANYAIQVQPGKDVHFIQGLITSLVHLGLNRTLAPAGLPSLQDASLVCGVPAQLITAVASELGSAKKPVFVFGKGLKAAERAEVLETLQALASMLGEVAFFNPKGKANSLAAHCFDLDKAFEPQGYEAVYAMGDDMPTKRLVKRLNEVPFLAMQASYASPLTERADVVLPVEMWAEQEGHFLNLEGRLQEAHRGIQAPEGVRSNVDVLVALAECRGAEALGDWKAEILERVPVKV